ncbi:hypothetical protein FQA39_LY14377 [Lamprigera yunnana]|nr:hypothetical protein FQA39_LY14377 [Lamprigera yunnana]
MRIRIEARNGYITTLIMKLRNFSMIYSLKNLRILKISPMLDLTLAVILHLVQSDYFGDGVSDMWERSGMVEGDMVLSRDQRNGLKAELYRWPNRQIPYVISNEYTYNEQQYIRNTLRTEFAKTCITVRPRSPADIDYVYVTNASAGCFSAVGRIGGKQILNLSKNGCIYYNTIVHEFLHAAGFYHQQSATDRDNYVTINWQNVIAGREDNFKKFNSSVITSYGLAYDYKSIMHYSRTAFSKNGLDTITPLKNVAIGVYQFLSNTDIEKISKMYNC